MMRVAYVCADPGVPVFGSKGCSIHVQEILRAMSNRGFDVDLFASRVGGSPPDDLEQVAVHQLTAPPSGIDSRARERALVALNRGLRLQLEHCGSFDLIYERHALWSHAAQEYAVDSDTPSILEVNAPLLEEQAAHRQLHNAPLASRLARESFQQATLRLAVSPAVGEHIAAQSGSAANILVQPNGVDPERFANARAAISARWHRRIEEGRAEKLVVGFVGTLRPWHGMGVLGAAFRQLHQQNSEAELLVVGDGPARDELFAALGPLAAEATTVTGRMPHKNVADWLACVDIAVAPYPDHPDFYFSPLKVFEYMACGLPIVASRIGTLGDYLIDGETGTLVPPRDAHALAGAIRYLQHRPGHALSLGHHAANVVSQHHTWQMVLDNALGQLERCVAQPSARIA